MSTLCQIDACAQAGSPTVLLPQSALQATVREQSGQAGASQAAGHEDSADKNAVTGYTLSREQYRKAVQYSHAFYRLHFLRVAYGLLLLLLVLRWRLGPKFRDLAEQASRRRLLQAPVFALPLLLTLAVLRLPARAYGHWLHFKYGQSIQGWGSWLWDWAKEQLLSVVFGAVLVWLLYTLIRRSARRWWLWFWAAAIPIAAFVVFIAPVAVDPLFFKFEPLAPRQPQLVAEIEQLTQRAGLRIPPDRMFLMKASQKVRTVDAYMTGFGASKRVVIWDTTLAKLTLPQTLFVFGHEMGHYVLHHIRTGFVLFCAGLLVALYLLNRCQKWLLARWGKHWQIRGLEDWASLPVLLLLTSVLGFLAEPVNNSISRYVEHQADVYGLEVIHGQVPDSAQVAAQSFQILGEIDLDDPDPPAFITFWLYSHPPLAERIRFALTYDPWSKGQRPQFLQR